MVGERLADMLALRSPNFAQAMAPYQADGERKREVTLTPNAGLILLDEMCAVIETACEKLENTAPSSRTWQAHNVTAVQGRIDAFQRDCKYGEKREAHERVPITA